MAEPSVDVDQVDVILAQWTRERPDLDPSPMAILGRISRLAPVINERLGRVFNQHGLDFPTFDVLATLRRDGEPYTLTPSQLAASMMVTPGAVTQRLTRLEDEGLVSRAHDSFDRRKVAVTLTRQGLDLIDTAIEDHDNNEHYMLSVYSDEERELLAGLLRRLVIWLNDPASRLPMGKH